MDREVARTLLHDVRRVLHDIDPAKLYSSVAKPDHHDYDDLALVAMKVLTEGGTGAATADAVVEALREGRGVKLGRVSRRLLRSGFTKLQIT